MRPAVRDAAARRLRFAELTSEPASSGSPSASSSPTTSGASNCRSCSADSSSTRGMLEKHRLARTVGTEQPWWSTLVYWVCWLFLAALAIYAAVRVR